MWCAARAQRLGWYWNRLRCMTPLEWAHRTGRALQARAECWGVLRLPKAPPADFSAQPQPWIAAPPTPERRALIAAAGRIMQGRFDLFALRDVPLGTPPKWNRDPKTGTAAPLRFGKRLDYRDPALVGDIKYLWELNRHAHLLTLAQAYAARGARAYYSAIRVHLESWFAECPCPFGPNWSSALEAALRLIHWSAAWQMLGGAGSPLFHGADDVGFRARWLSSIYEHACFVRGFFSRHSSANNHLIGEA